MKYSIKDVDLLVEQYKNQPEVLQVMLQRVFSFDENIDTFSQFFFPHLMTNKTPSFHRELYKIFFSDKNEAVAAPRGFSKSTTIGNIFIPFCIVNKRVKYIVYISQNHSKTVQFVDPVRQEFKLNEKLRFVYGDLTPQVNQDDTGRDREDCFDVNSIRLEALSFEKNIRGFRYKGVRPDFLVLDDIEDDERVLNPDLRLKDLNKLNKAIIPSLDINGRLKMIGTILHQDSLLKNRIKTYNGKVFKAIDENGKLLWADRFTKKILDKIKEDIGSVAFESEYLNNPCLNEMALIKREWIEQCFREDLSMEELTSKEFEMKILGVDFAFSDRVTADNSSFIGIGKKEEKLYLMYNELKKGWSASEQMNYLKNNVQPKYDFNFLALEENSIKAISKDIKQYKLPIHLYWTGSRDPAQKKPKVDIRDREFVAKRHTIGKMAMIGRLSTAFENKRFIIPYKTEYDKRMADRLMDELTTFALSNGQLVEVGMHSDMGISLGLSLDCMDSFKPRVALV